MEDAAYNIWKPVGNVVVGNITTTTPKIRPQYHAFLVVAEVIGNAGKSRIAEIFVGSSQCLSVCTGARPVNTAQLQGLNQNATWKPLYIPYADVADGVTWSGQNFTTDSGLSLEILYLRK